MTLTQTQTILERLREHLALPWPDNVSARERVVMVVYPPSDERKLRRMIESGEFASEIKTTGHGWVEHDLAPDFSTWLANFEYRDRYLAKPERLWDDAGNVRGLEEYLVAKIAEAAKDMTANDVLALIGGGGLFGLHSVSTLIERIESHVPGRLVIFFPGEHDARNNSYRLLGAKDAGKFNRKDVTASSFSRESAPLSNDEKRAIARLVKCKPDEAEAHAPEYVATLKDALARATGAAPRPEARPSELIDELTALSGRDLVKRLAEEEKNAANLLAALEAQAAKITQREPQWQQLNDLLGYMKGLAEAAALTTERDAIREGRLLLDDPDKVGPLVHRAADVLRTAMNKNFAAYRSEYERCTKELEAAPQWGKLAPEDRAAILREVQLSAPENTPALGTLAELLASLAVCSPQRWTEKRDALGGQLTRALTLAAQKLEPKVQPLTPPHRILHNEADLDAWLAEVRTAVIKKLSDGPVQL